MTNQKLVTYRGRNVVREGGGRRGGRRGEGGREEGEGPGGWGVWGVERGDRGVERGEVGKGGPEYANTPRTGVCKYPVGNSYV